MQKSKMGRINNTNNLVRGTFTKKRKKQLAHEAASDDGQSVRTKRWIGTLGCGSGPRDEMLGVRRARSLLAITPTSVLCLR